MGLDVYLATIGLGVTGALLYFVLIKDKPYPRTFYLMFFLVTYVFAFENFCIYLYRIGVPNNNLYYNIFYVYIQSLVTYYFFYSILGSETFKKFLTYYIPAFLIWGLIVSVFLQPIDYLPQGYTYIMAAGGIIVCCVFFFYELLKRNYLKADSLLAFPHFWIVAFMMVFYTSGFIYFIFLGIPELITLQIAGIFASINRGIAAMMYLVMGFSHFSTILFSTKNGRQFI